MRNRRSSTRRTAWPIPNFVNSAPPGVYSSVRSSRHRLWIFGLNEIIMSTLIRNSINFVSSGEVEGTRTAALLRSLSYLPIEFQGAPGAYRSPYSACPF